MQDKSHEIIDVKVTVTDEFAHSVLTTAAEGGCDWATVRVTKGTSTDYTEVSMQDNEDDTSEVFLVDAAKIRLGIQKVLDGSCDLNCRWQLFAAVGSDDAGSVDAEIADGIVQAALFGDLVYG